LSVDGCAAAHPVHIVSVNRHLLGVDKLVDHGFAVRGGGMRDEASVV